ncbi:tetratricopeptide repeat protein [Pelotomaculum propionicicum]|uniref:Uncharacterized protein n=1 Tax=Pelotomaculum propionicicum TaxID=258475 RepID=A0A4Y7RUL6_9FIRM|nr:tetratricopeptide repeat protein [Pelotomaculum propionicicum]NLI11338.1 tetratricopeptide repeat protein [Peptococcaceae bacterium]TEB12446.1 hypothetical protein Pmgp_01063 [Pelotomaculum propionicicum]
MAINKKYGINPRLISLITGKDLSEIPDSPTASMLPGHYGRIVARKMDKFSREFPKNVHSLTCTSCNHKGNYDLGLVVIDNKKLKNLSQDKSIDGEIESPSIMDCIQATGYFRCRQCNAAGYWKFSAKTEMAFYIGSISAAIFDNKDASKQLFTYGVLNLADGSRHRWATDAEEHYLNKLAGQPEDSFTWNRLANSYLKGGRPDLAAVAFEQSLKIDPAQMESLYSLGKILHEAGEDEAAARYLRQVLINAKRYGRMKAEDMRDMLTSTMEYLLIIYDDFEKFLSALPKAQDMLLPGETLSDSCAIGFMDLTIYPDDYKSFYPLAEMYMGKRRDELADRTFCKSISKADKNLLFPEGRREKKSGKKKKKKGKK